MTHVEKLVARLRNDRYWLDDDDTQPLFRWGWNSAMQHVETVILPDLDAALRELRDAEPIDLRLKVEMTGGVE